MTLLAIAGKPIWFILLLILLPCLLVLLVICFVVKCAVNGANKARKEQNNEEKSW